MYREDNDQVVLTMSREDYILLMDVFAIANRVAISKDRGKLLVCDLFHGTDLIVGLLNRLNSGNPNYTPVKS